MAQLNQFLTELWILYSIAVAFTALRVLARVRAVGWRGFQTDDYLTLGAIVSYTAQVAVAHSGGSLYYSQVATRAELGQSRPPPQPNTPQMDIRVTGAKYHFCLWILYATSLWLLKGSLLVLYTRLTMGLAGNYRSRILFGFGLLVTSLIAVLLTVFLACRPFGDYFDSVHPIVRNVCIPGVSRPIVWTCYAFNVLTDLYLIALPLPLLFQTTMKPWKKAGLAILFSGGAAIIACATVRCVLLTTNPANGAPLSGNWGVREVFVAVITTNAPIVFTLVRGVLGPTIWSRFTTDPSKLKGFTSSGNEKETELETIGGRRGGGVRGRGRGGVGDGGLTTQMLFTESEEKMVKDEDQDHAANLNGDHAHMLGPALEAGHGRMSQEYADPERAAGPNPAL